MFFLFVVTLFFRDLLVHMLNTLSLIHIIGVCLGLSGKIEILKDGIHILVWDFFEKLAY